MPYAADIRKGRHCPHPRHWLALAELVGVSPRAVLPHWLQARWLGRARCSQAGWSRTSASPCPVRQHGQSQQSASPSPLREQFGMPRQTETALTQRTVFPSDAHAVVSFSASGGTVTLALVNMRGPPNTTLSPSTSAFAPQPGSASNFAADSWATPELLARVRAVLRRRSPSLGLSHMHPGLIEIDFEARQVKGPHGQVHLTAKEFELPFYLAPHPKKAVSHRELLHAV